MSIEPQSIQVGQCYLSDGGMVRRVVRILPDGRVQYEWRGGNRLNWKPGILSSLEFTASTERLVPCSWAPEDDA